MKVYFPPRSLYRENGFFFAEENRFLAFFLEGDTSHRELKLLTASISSFIGTFSFVLSSLFAEVLSFSAKGKGYQVVISFNKKNVRVLSPSPFLLQGYIRVIKYVYLAIEFFA
jgi:hypothetical protein